jgi:hypothetical protein
MWRRLSMMAGFWPTLVLQMLLLSAAAVWVWQSGIRNEVEDLRSERFRFSLLHVKSVLESGLRLGNATADLPGATSLIREVRDRQPDILSIDIFDAQGDVLFSTDPGGLGLKVPAAWTQACLRADAGNPWIDQDVDGGVQCAALVDAFGQGTGGVVLRHRRSARAAPELTLPEDWPVLATVVAVLMLAAAVAAVVAVQPLQRQARQLRAAVEATSGTGQPVPDGTVVSDPFGPATKALQALSDQDRWLAQTDAEADRLDRLESA